MEQTFKHKRKRIVIPVAAGLLGSILLAAIYFGIVSWVESFTHAVQLFSQDRWIVLPIILGFGTQAALYAILKLKLYLPISNGESTELATIPATGASMGASGTTSTIAMVACCAHHVTDILPILGLTAAATFLAKYRLLFMGVGLGTTILGITYMGFLLLRERKKAMTFILNPLPVKDTL